MNAPRRFAISNPLPSTLSFRIRSRPLCHSESALAVRNLLLSLQAFGDFGPKVLLKKDTGKIR